MVTGWWFVSVALPGHGTVMTWGRLSSRLDLHAEVQDLQVQRDNSRVSEGSQNGIAQPGGNKWKIRNVMFMVSKWFDFSHGQKYRSSERSIHDP